MTDGIGDFKVSAGKDLSPSESGRESGRRTGKANLHYIVILKKSWGQTAPLRFHSGMLDDIRGRLKLTAKVPLPEMPNFFPHGAEGEITFSGRHVLHVDSALREQSLFSHLETLRQLVQKCAERKTIFSEFVAGLNQIPIPTSWRNEIVNGLFQNAQATESPKPVSKPPGLSQDIDKLMGLLQEKDTGGSRLSPHLGHFLDEVGRDSTGFIMKDGAARHLYNELTQALAALRGSLLRQDSLAETLGFIFSVQRLTRYAKGRDRQCIHLWSDIPDDAPSLLVGENADEGGESTMAIVLLDPRERDPAFLRQVAGLAAKLNCPILLQAAGEAVPEDEVLSALAESGSNTPAYIFAGGVASRVDEEACVFRPAVLAFLEGLVSSREMVSFYEHRFMVLEDQDLITEKGQARSSDRLLDQAQIIALSQKGINRVNGAKNQSSVSFPLLTPWGDR